MCLRTDLWELSNLSCEVQGLSKMTKPSPSTNSPMSTSSTHYSNSNPFSISLPSAAEAMDNPQPMGSPSAGSMRTPTHPLRSPTGSLSAEGILGNAGRQRHMSTSSMDRDVAIEGIDIPTSEPRPNPRKRPSSDALEYPRRRATIAV